MEAQLHLLPADTTSPADRPTAATRPDGEPWRLDEPTRALGRRGVAAARSALQAAPRYRTVVADPDHAERPASAA
jgi:hypothetical protein